jgi:transposase
MAYNFLPYEPEQMFLMPPAIDSWVREDSLARFVSDLVDQFDAQGKLQRFYDVYRLDGRGQAAYHPRMMIKVIVYGYCIGVTSSRKIEKAIEEDVSFRYLAANQNPNFRTISDFRKDHLEDLNRLFVEVLSLCKEAGLAKMGRVALDGRRVQGNAALDQNRKLEWIKTEVARILSEAACVDRGEDELYGEDSRGDELPEGLRNREERLTRLREAQERLEDAQRRAAVNQAKKIARRESEEKESGKKKRGRKPKTPEEVVNADSKANITDPESRIMKTRRGWAQGYNGQAMSDCETQVIVCQDVTQEENDVNQLSVMLARCEEQADKRPDELVADAGYWSEANAQAGGETTELYIATTKEWKQRKKMREEEVPQEALQIDATEKDQMERKLLTERGREAYRDRGKAIEPVFGQMWNRGLNRFLLRGLKKVSSEWSIWCTTHNILKLWRSGYKPQVVMA